MTVPGGLAQLSKWQRKHFRCHVMTMVTLTRCLFAHAVLAASIRVPVVTGSCPRSRAPHGREPQAAPPFEGRGGGARGQGDAVGKAQPVCANGKKPMLLGWRPSVLVTRRYYIVAPDISEKANICGAAGVSREAFSEIFPEST